MSKKYFWLKLKENFFRQKEIKKLRKIAGGDTYTIIYLKMMLLSLEYEGRLFYSGIEESFPEEIALDIDEDPDNVSVTIIFLKKCGLLVELTENEFLLNKEALNIGSETESAERVRRFRERQKALLCNDPVTDRNTEKELEKEKKKDKKNKQETNLLDYLEKKIIETYPNGYSGYVSNDKTLFLKTPLPLKIIEFFEYRQSLQKKDRYKTTRGIDGLFRDLNNCSKMGYDLIICMDICMDREPPWKTPSAEYFKNRPEFKTAQQKPIYQEKPQQSIDELLANPE